MYAHEAVRHLLTLVHVAAGKCITCACCLNTQQGLLSCSYLVTIFVFLILITLLQSGVVYHECVESTAAICDPQGARTVVIHFISERRWQLLRQISPKNEIPVTVFSISYYFTCCTWGKQREGKTIKAKLHMTPKGTAPYSTYISLLAAVMTSAAIRKISGEV